MMLNFIAEISVSDVVNCTEFFFFFLADPVKPGRGSFSSSMLISPVEDDLGGINVSPDISS